MFCNHKPALVQSGRLPALQDSRIVPSEGKGKPQFLDNMRGMSRHAHRHTRDKLSFPSRAVMRIARGVLGFSFFEFYDSAKYPVHTSFPPIIFAYNIFDAFPGTPA